MAKGEKRVHLRPRLQAAAEMLRGARVVADIGCDHGRLILALVQQGACARAIGADISGASLEKARLLSKKIGLQDRIELRQGDGLIPIAPGEADAAALLGMGGALMTRILDACAVPFQGAERIVFQPMRAPQEIRRWLYCRGWAVIDDRVVLDAGRYYQVFSALPPSGAPDALPEGWPADCFTVGYRAFAERDPLLPLLAEQRLAQCKKRLCTSSAETLQREAENMRRILDAYAAGE